MASSAADVVRRVREAVAESLDRQKLLRGRRLIVVAVSGGPDSVCLLDALSSVVARPEKRLIVGHVDHALRPESAEDASFVRRLAEGYGLRYETTRVEVAALARTEHLGIEEAARLGRYRALGEIAVEAPGVIVATGHTRDDSTETVLLHLLRGTGRRGLVGIAQTERLPAEYLGLGTDAVRLTIVRPLLGVGREDTSGYCEARALQWRTDATNVNPRFLRNRVRHHLLPVLRTYNSSVDQSLVRLADIVAAEETWLETVTARAWRRIGEQVDDSPTVSLEAWRRQPLALRRRLVRMVAEQLGCTELSYEAVERVVAVAEAGGPRAVQLSDGLRVRRTRERLIFEAEGAEKR